MPKLKQLFTWLNIALRRFLCSNLYMGTPWAILDVTPYGQQLVAQYK